MAEENEVTETNVLATEVPEQKTIPDKFQGKSVEEVAHAYQELEQLAGRHATEVGEARKELESLRKFTDSLLKSELRVSSTEDGGKPDVDPNQEFLEKPIESTRTIVKEVLEKDLSGVREKLRLAEMEKAQSRLQEKHPDAASVVTTEEFKEFVKASPIRQQLFLAATTKGSFEAADELLTVFKELNGVKEEAGAKGGKMARVRNLQTEKGSSAVSAGRKVYSRREMVNLRSTNPREYERRMPEFRAAYERGDVTN